MKLFKHRNLKNYKTCEIGETKKKFSWETNLDIFWFPKKMRE